MVNYEEFGVSLTHRRPFKIDLTFFSPSRSLSVSPCPFPSSFELTLSQRNRFSLMHRRHRIYEFLCNAKIGRIQSRDGRRDNQRRRGGYADTKAVIFQLYLCIFRCFRFLSLFPFSFVREYSRVGTRSMRRTKTGRWLLSRNCRPLLRHLIYVYVCVCVCHR